MANYYGNGRSNYFFVTDVSAFELWCEAWDCEMLECPSGRVGFIAQAEDGFPFNAEIDEEGGCAADYEESLQLLLKDADQEVLFFQSGWEKMRYGSFSFGVITKDSMVYTTLEDLCKVKRPDTSIPHY